LLATVTRVIVADRRRGPRPRPVCDRASRPGRELYGMFRGQYRVRGGTIRRREFFQKRGSLAERGVAQRGKRCPRKRHRSYAGPKVRIHLPPAASQVRTRFFTHPWRSSRAAAVGALTLAGDDRPPRLDLMEPAKIPRQNAERLEGSRKCQIKSDGSMRSSTFSGCRATRHIEITLEN
jgi:hypothetical protein